MLAWRSLKWGLSLMLRSQQWMWECHLAEIREATRTRGRVDQFHRHRENQLMLCCCWSVVLSLVDDLARRVFLRTWTRAACEWPFGQRCVAPPRPRTASRPTWGPLTIPSSTVSVGTRRRTRRLSIRRRLRPSLWWRPGTKSTLVPSPRWTSNRR